MDDPIPLLITIIILILISAYFSATETAFSKYNKVKMKKLANDGDRKAKTVMKLSDDFDRLLSTILIGNNIVNIASASLSTILFTKLLGDIGVSVSTIVMTIIVLIFGEITPKSIANDMPVKIALLSAPILSIVFQIFKPLNYLFSLWKKVTNKFFNFQNTAEEITEQEIAYLVEEATQEGNINARSSNLIMNAIEFDDLDVMDICTPRTDIVAIKETAGIDEIMKTFENCGFSRLPVFHDTIDDIYGFISQKDFYRYMVHGQQNLDKIIHPILFVTPTMSISNLMAKLQKDHVHISLIVDEFGNTLGIATLEDILEELVGEIWDEHDMVVDYVIPISETEYRVYGTANISKVLEKFGISCDTTYVSINGFLIDKLKRIPQIGDHFNYEGLYIEITKADSRRALEIMIRKEEGETQREVVF